MSKVAVNVRDAENLTEGGTKTMQEELVFAGVFEGKDIMVTPEVKRVIDYLNSEIRILTGRER